MVTYLADAAATGRCTFIENCAVDKVETAVDPTTGRRRAVGVVATVNRMHTVRVKARRCVVVSAGSLHSPGVLLRSGLPNPHIGRHLRLHPVTAVLGTFDRPNFGEAPLVRDPLAWRSRLPYSLCPCRISRCGTVFSALPPLFALCSHFHGASPCPFPSPNCAGTDGSDEHGLC